MCLHFLTDSSARRYLIFLDLVLCASALDLTLQVLAPPDSAWAPHVALCCFAGGCW